MGRSPTSASDIATLTGFLKAGDRPLLEGIGQRRLPAGPDRHVEQLDQLFQMVDQKYDNNAPFDGNVSYGMALAYTTLQALKAAGKNLNRGASYPRSRRAASPDRA